MALSFGERSPDLYQIMKDAIQGELANVWTALPCEVKSYDVEAVTIIAQPLIKIPVKKRDGKIELLTLPPLPDVPIMFSGAGGFTITHPIHPGDECLVIFASRNIDIWWQQGEIQNPFDTRKHDLSDGFALFRPQSQTKKIRNISTQNLEIRNNEDTCKIQVTATGEIHFIGSKSVFHHPVEIQQSLSVSGATSLQSKLDVQGKSTLEAGAKISGIEFVNHKHAGVKNGGDSTSPPTS